jgi:hypothetical protein
MDIGGGRAGSRGPWGGQGQLRVKGKTREKEGSACEGDAGWS